MQSQFEEKVGGGHQPEQDKKITVLVIINGQPYPVEVNVNVPVKNLVQKALNESGNTGQPLDRWQIKLGDQVLDLDKKVKDYDIHEGTELFLSLKAGHGGAKYSLWRMFNLSIQM